MSFNIGSVLFEVPGNPSIGKRHRGDEGERGDEKSLEHDSLRKVGLLLL